MTRTPPHLSKESASWFKKIATEFGIRDQGGVLILQTVCEAFDRMRACQTAIEEQGATTLDRWGQVKIHPLCATERDARAQVLAGLKALNLDIMPSKILKR
jgi:P27 family predicted phage terminase small subunit